MKRTFLLATINYRIIHASNQGGVH
uniref:Uncharacterized protein n=1 Tax=Tetranychus urticae TaxID=32264 RepID=T1KD87_TETUR